MPDKAQNGILKSKIWNGFKVFLKDNADMYQIWTELVGIVEFQPPAQPVNMVDLPFADEDDGITWSEKGSRTGGDISGSMNVKNLSPESLADFTAAITALKTAYFDEFGDYSLKWVFPNGENVLIEHCKITDCSLQGGSRDTAVSYTVAARANSKIKYYQAAQSGQ